MGHYRKKPVIVEAVRFDGCEYVDDIPTPMFEGSFDIVPEWITDARAKGEGEAGAMFVDRVSGELVLAIVTLEGQLYASAGAWIIQGTAGEIYPCKPGIFTTIYEGAEVPLPMPPVVPPATDPRTGRTYGDHGSASQALDFALDHMEADLGDQLDFLEAWRLGAAADGWPEFYTWLLEQQSPPADEPGVGRHELTAGEESADA